MVLVQQIQDLEYKQMMEKNNSLVPGEIKINSQSKTPSLRAAKTMRMGEKKKISMIASEQEHESSGNDESQSSDNESEL